MNSLDWSHEGRVERLAANKELCDERTWRISLGRRTPADLDAEWDHASEEG